MMNHIRTRALLSSAGLALICASAAHAQEAGSAERPGAQTEAGDSIIVTARRVGENLQGTPLAVTAMGAEELETRVIQDANDLGKVVPSLTTLQNATGAAGLFLQLRGLVQTDTAAFQAGSVGVYQDDLYVGGAMIAGQLLNLSDLERVEVLKGPQGTLYGRNVTGGVVKFVTRKPGPDFEGYAKVGYGSYDRWLGEGMINVPVGDTVAFRLNGSYENRGGYSRDVVNNRDLENVERWTVRGGLSFEPTSEIQVLLQGSYGEYRGNGSDTRGLYIDPNNANAMMAFIAGQRINGLTGASFAPLIFGAAAGFTPAQISAAGAAFAGAVPTAVARFYEYRDAPRDQARQYPGLQTGDFGKLGYAALTLSYDLSDDITFKSITGYTYAGRSSRYTVGGDALTIITSAQQGSVSQWSQELQTTGTALDDRLTFAAGVFYIKQDITDDRNPGNIAGFAPYSLGQRGLGLTNTTFSFNDIEVESVAPYAQASFEIVPTVNVTGGLRYTYEHFGVTQTAYASPSLSNGNRTVCQAPAPATSATAIANCIASRSVNFRNLSYTVGADWAITPDVLLYVRSGKGFKAGGANPFSPAYLPIQTFSPEQNTDYEIGLKTELFDRMVRFNINYYHTDYSNIQRTVVETAAGTTITQVKNAASAKIDGVEAELNIRPTRGFNVGGTVTWTRARYDEYRLPNPAFPTGFVDISNQVFQSLPEWQYTIYANYDMETSWGGIRAGVNWAGRGTASVGTVDIPITPTSPVAPASVLQQSPYGLLGASLAFDIKAFNATVSVWGKNLLDERYLESGTCLVSLGLGACFGNYGAPATYGAEVTFRF